MMFKIRTEPVTVGTEPYNWKATYLWQCTWYAFYRALEAGFTPPCYWDRATRTGSYTNAKEWPANFREPWEVKDPSWTPKAGDILVYDGELGHVIFCETDVMTTEYRSGDPNSFRIGKTGDYKGRLLNILHYPYEPLAPVERNTSMNQIECLDNALRIRTKPSLEGEIVGHVQLGYYNVLQTEEAEGYTWYRIGQDRWCAGVSVIYLPKEESIITEIERYFNEMKTQIDTLEQGNRSLKDDMKAISDIASKW
ncbi:MAG: CHAP domain-containing protein [Erysipelotrichaceae bacterium]|nr:CHAP domain-containing protein [Erysipelotrichaceae bacterium]